MAPSILRRKMLVELLSWCFRHPSSESINTSFETYFIANEVFESLLFSVSISKVVFTSLFCLLHYFLVSCCRTEAGREVSWCFHLLCQALMLQIYRKWWFNQQLLSCCDPVHVHHPGAPSCFFLLLTDGLILKPFLSVYLLAGLGCDSPTQKGQKQFIIFSLFSPLYNLKNPVGPLEEWVSHKNVTIFCKP